MRLKFQHGVDCKNNIIKDALEATRFSQYAWLSEEINQSMSEGLQCDSFARRDHALIQACACCFIDRGLLLLFSLQWPSFTIWSFISLTLWSFRSMVSFLSAQSWCKYLLTNVTGNLLSKYWLKIKTSFGFFLPPWGCYYTWKAHTQVRLSLLSWNQCSQGLPNVTWNPKCKWCQSPILVQNANRNL